MGTSKPFILGSAGRRWSLGWGKWILEWGKPFIGPPLGPGEAPSAYAILDAPIEVCMAFSQDQLVRRAAPEVCDGTYVNLGIDPFPRLEEVDADLINAGKQRVTAAAKRVVGV